MGQSDRDERLDRWWSPPELALLWSCSANTARARLRSLNRRKRGKLIEERVGAVRSHVRVWGRELEKEIPGSLTRRTPEDLKALRELRQRIDEHDERLDLTDAWRESATPVLRSVRAVG